MFLVSTLPEGTQIIILYWLVSSVESVTSKTCYNNMTIRTLLN